MQLIKSIKYLKNILSKKINKGFSLLEITLILTISSFFILSIIFSMLFIHFSLIRAKNDSININEMSTFIDIISFDILNADLHPHRPVKDYEFLSNKIVFYSNAKKVCYEYKNNNFVITKDDKSFKFNFIKKFSINYYDTNGYKTIIDITKESAILPYYCEITVGFNDNKIKTFKMRI